ncbi:MAG TPA: histidine phosphatase family protein [Acidimicrobiales bacterium]|nr:histidine phosphatase family protein [Acidimicrobiales bacterium]
MIWLARHGETEWSASGRHTSRTDVDLTAAGRRQAAALGQRLASRSFALVLVSPRLRARRTCELAGLGSVAEVDPDLAEWDYGDYEGRTTAEIHRDDPGWSLWDGGAPGGETPDEVAARADRVLARASAATGDVLVFAHGHLLRVLAARWVGETAGFGRHLRLSTASLSRLDHEHGTPAIGLWNDAGHLAGLSG